ITLGKTFVRLKKYEESLPHLKKAIELAPKNPEPHYQIAIAYRRLGRISEAKRENEIVKRIHRDRRNSNKVKKGDVNN
ncbi:MAG: tetratricopeptide repeat protein, partial [Pyrinomonadaceae bacterium]|nr:tetratricopeptide repeat protein [Pyrinomonadaceae bacterium]